MIAAIALAADIYVSPTGNDAAAGTADAPLATIAAARDKADELKASGPVVVHLKAGTYYLKEPVVFGPLNSGTASAPILYKGEGKAVISGGIKVTATWTTSSGSIMKTTIDKNLKVDQLFLNGKRQIMARYPNFKESAYLQGYASDALSKAQACANPTEGPGYIRSLHTSMWGGESYILTKSGSSVSAAWVGDNNRGGGMHSTYRMAENCYEFLDAQGEWFYRKSTGDLFFWPPSGTDLNSATIELASLTELLRCVGSDASSANSVKYIAFDGVILTHTYRSLFDGTGQFYELVTKSDWGIVRKGTVFMQNTENITIKNCMFDQIGGNGVFMSGYNRNNVVYNCDFEDAGASCVCLFGLKSAWRCYNSWSGASCSDYANPGPRTNEYPSNCRIDNNMMNHLGRFEKQTAGFTCSGTEFDTIRHNTIHNIPRAGINFCDGSWGGHLIDYNWVYDCVNESGDHGPFNAWGRDRIEIAGEGNLGASKLDARNTTIIRNNRFESNPGMFGIDMDDQATNYYQEKNLCIAGGLKLQWNRYNTYLNNILIRGANVQFHGVWKNSNHYGARNIIVGSQNYTCVYQCLSGNSPSSTKGAIAQWDSNDVYCGGSQASLSTWSQNAGCGSSVANWSQWTGAGLDAHSITADPQFTDTQKVWRSGYLPRGDFNPKSGSPALSLGFKPFPMDSFGVMGTPGPNGNTDVAFDEQRKAGGNAAFGFLSLSVNYNARGLTVSFGGDYQVAVMSVSGRTLATFNGNGRSTFVLDGKRIGCGMYFALIYMKNGLVSRRFIIN